jgi:hypothetical protein
VVAEVVAVVEVEVELVLADVYYQEHEDLDVVEY